MDGTFPKGVEQCRKLLLIFKVLSITIVYKSKQKLKNLLQFRKDKLKICENLEYMNQTVLNAMKRLRPNPK